MPRKEIWASLEIIYNFLLHLEARIIEVEIFKW